MLEKGGAPLCLLLSPSQPRTEQRSTKGSTEGCNGCDYCVHVTSGAGWQPILPAMAGDWARAGTAALMRSSLTRRDCRSLRRPPHVADATGDDDDGHPSNPLPDAGPALRRWRLGKTPFSGNVGLPMPVQRHFADAEPRSDIPKCAPRLQSLIDGLALRMGTDGAQPSHCLGMIA